MITVAFTGINSDGVAYNLGTNKFDITGKETIVDGTFTLTANYGTGTSHGDIADFTSVAPPTATNIGSYAPTRVEVYEAPQAGAAALGFQFVYCPGPNITTADGCTQAGGVLQILGGAAGAGQGLQEITEGSAYSSYTPSLNNAVIRFRAWFSRG